VSQNYEYCKGFDHVSLQRLIYLIFHYNTAVFRDKEYVASMNYSIDDREGGSTTSKSSSDPTDPSDPVVDQVRPISSY
jgi:hypothetical protein